MIYKWDSGGEWCINNCVGDNITLMRFNSTHPRHFGAGGLSGFFRPIIRFFKNILLPSARNIGKTVVNSKTGRKGLRALKKAAVNITADAISGGPSADTPSTHISKARAEVAKAVRDSQISEKIKKKRGKKKIGVKSMKSRQSNQSFFN